MSIIYQPTCSLHKKTMFEMNACNGFYKLRYFILYTMNLPLSISLFHHIEQNTEHTEHLYVQLRL